MPPPRAAPEDRTDPMLTYIADSVLELGRSLDRGLEGIRRELAELPSLYVPRRELERRLDELTLDLAELRQDHEATERAREERAREERRERRNLRLGLAGLGVAGASATTGVLALVLSHLPL